MNENTNIANQIRKAVNLVPITKSVKKQKVIKSETVQISKISHQKQTSTFQPVKSRFKQTSPGFKIIKVKSKNGNN